MVIGRGAFQNKQAERAVIRLAPDVLVFINRNLYLPVCRACKRAADFQTDISSVSVSLGTETIPGSASITVEAPRYSIRNYMENGSCVFKAMQEVEIWEKGRFLVNGEPQYYPTFWGLISSVDVNSSVPATTISIEAEGILKWWQLSFVNMSPALTDQSWGGGFFQATPRASVLWDLNPYQIMFYIAMIAVGDLVGPQEITGYSQGKNTPQAQDKKAYMTPGQEAVFTREFSQVRDYWFHRFGEIGRSLRMFGLNSIKSMDITRLADRFTEEFAPNAGVTDDQGNQEPLQLGNLQDMWLWNALIPEFGLARDLISKVKPYYFVSNGISAAKSEMLSKAEIAQYIASAIGFEFYMDTTGEIMFKPPFYNMDVRDNAPFSVIKDEDIFSINQTEEAPIATRVDVRGTPDNLIHSDTGIIYGWDINYRLVQKYGYKPVEKQINFMRNSLACYYYARSELSRINADINRITMEIVSRPELRLGFPVYIESLDKFAYVSTKSQSFSYGGSVRTSLGLTAVRGKYILGSQGSQSSDRFTHWQTDRNSGETKSSYGDGSEAQKSGGLPDLTGTQVGTPMVAFVFDGNMTRAGRSYGEIKAVNTTEPGQVVSKIYGNPIQLLATEETKGSKIKNYNFNEEAWAVLPIGTYEGEWKEVELQPGDPLYILFTQGTIDATDNNLVVEERAVSTEYTDLGGKKVSVQDKEDTQAGVYLSYEHPGISMRAFLVSDKRGYELIGGFRYGRDIGLTEAGLMNIDTETQSLRASQGVRNPTGQVKTLTQLTKEAQQNTFVKFAGMDLGASVEQLRGSIDRNPSMQREFCRCTTPLISQLAYDLAMGRKKVTKTEFNLPGDFGAEDNAVKKRIQSGK